MQAMVVRRNTPISVFVVCWTLIFHYETLRHNYLRPLFNREPPKLPLLFPPAGWIMFYNVDRSYGFAEVYGRLATEPVLLDPHEILKTKAIGYDNIHRNVLVGVLSQRAAPSFCRHLRRTFPAYDSFAVIYAAYPDLIETPDRIRRQVAYRCQ